MRRSTSASHHVLVLAAGPHRAAHHGAVDLEDAQLVENALQRHAEPRGGLLGVERAVRPRVARDQPAQSVGDRLEVGVGRPGGGSAPTASR